MHSDSVLHPRPLHVSWNGLTLRHDDPWWHTHFPPNGWGCRCRITAVAKPDPARDTAPDDGSYTKTDRFGVEHVIPKGIDYGWDYQPGANIRTELRRFVQDKLVQYRPSIAKALSHEVNRYINATDRPPEFVRRVLSDRELVEPLWLGFVERFDAIRASTGIDTQGYLALLPAEAPRHVARDHEFDGNGQRPPRPEDYDKIIAVLNEYDEMKPGRDTGNGQNDRRRDISRRVRNPAGEEESSRRADLIGHQDRKAGGSRCRAISAPRPRRPKRIRPVCEYSPW